MYEFLGKIDKILSKIDSKAIGARARTKQLTGAIRELEYITYRTLSVLQRMGLPDNLSNAMSKIQKMILTVMVLHRALMWLQSTTMYGQIMGVITIASGVINATDLMAETIG